MSTRHAVVAGDHLTSLAETYGFRDYKTIWDHADNADLKQLRGDPHVLYPGDVVVIPDKDVRQEARPTGQTHRFRTPQQLLKLRIVLTDFDNEPIAGMACMLVVDGAVHQLVSGGDGLIETSIPRNAKQGLLQLPELDLEHELKIGHLDPVDEDTGWQGRLVNLGYYGGAVGDGEDELLRHAIEEFQCDNDLTVNGEPDDATRASLKQAHGS